MKKKKAAALGLAAVLAFGIFGAGCGSGGTKDSNKTDAENRADDGENGAGTGESVTFTYYNTDANQDDPWSDPVALAITEATNVKLDMSYPVSNSSEDIALMIANQDYPDFIYAKGDASKLVEAGALIDMTDLIEEYGPNIKKMYGDEIKKLQYSSEDPAIYQLSSYGMGGRRMTSAGTAQIQWDVLAENDYKYPTTLEEYEAMIKSYLKAHPTTDDGLDNIGISLCAADWRWMITLGNPGGYIAGYPDNGEWIIDENDQAIFKYCSDDVREYFQWLARMYEEGILDRDFATQTHEDYIAKIATGRVIGLTDQQWDYAEAETLLKSDGKSGKTYAGLPVTLNKDVKCKSLMYQGLTTGWGIAITTSCEDPVAAVKFLDFMCSDEGQVLTHWGIEGTNYFYDDDGHRYRTEEEIQAASTDQDYSKKTGVGFHVNGFPCYGDGVTDDTGNTYGPSDEASVKANYSDVEQAACEAMGINLLIDIFPQADEFETPAYSAVSTYAMPEEFNDIFNQLEEIAWPGLIKAVTGGISSFDANYDAMLKDFEGVGLSDAEEMMTAAVEESASWESR